MTESLLALFTVVWFRARGPHARITFDTIFKLLIIIHCTRRHQSMAIGIDRSVFVPRALSEWL